MVMSVALLSAAVKIRGGDLVIWQTGDDPASSSKFKLVGTTGAGAARAMQLQNVTVSGTAYRLAVSSEVDEATAERVSLTNAGLLGIGISAPVRTLHVKSVMRLEPQGTAPTGAKGELYCNTDGKLFVHEGTAGWREVSLAD